MSRIYRVPPLVEAVCELGFDSEQDWDWTIPGLLYERIQAEFPAKEQRNVLEVQFEARPGDDVKQNVKGGIARMRFLRSDGSALVQVGPNMLSISHLRPYRDWPTFRDIIDRVLEHYRAVADPEQITKVGLRYINRLEIPEASFQIEDYLTAVPVVPDPVPQEFGPFSMQVLIPLRDIDAGMLIRTGSIEPVGGKTALLLDMDVITRPGAALDFGGLGDWMDKAHTAIEATFEACLGPRARELFDEVTDSG
jgi:uncharacterized protein (TIGR04255 family)